MDILKYVGYFHDGGLIAILHNGDEIVISMTSAEVYREDIGSEIMLGNEGDEHDEMLLIKGKLHCEGVYRIETTDKNNLKFEMKYDSGGILDFEIKDNLVELGIEWIDYPPKERKTDYSYTKIEAKKIWWENIPDLHDPFL